MKFSSPLLRESHTTILQSQVHLYCQKELSPACATSALTSDRLSPPMFEAVQIWKSGYKSGTILAAAEVGDLEATADVSRDPGQDASESPTAN